MIFSRINGDVSDSFAYCELRAFKYITKDHGGVATEWQTVKITTAYNAYLDADACCVQVSTLRQFSLSVSLIEILKAMANAAFYQHFPLAAK